MNQRGHVFKLYVEQEWAHHILRGGGRFANYLRKNSGVKSYRSQAACTGVPALPVRCVWFCLVGRVTQLARGGECAPVFRSRFTTRTKTQRQRFGFL